MCWGSEESCLQPHHFGQRRGGRGTDWLAEAVSKKLISVFLRCQSVMDKTGRETLEDKISDHEQGVIPSRVLAVQPPWLEPNPEPGSGARH